MTETAPPQPQLRRRRPQGRAIDALHGLEDLRRSSSEKVLCWSSASSGPASAWSAMGAELLACALSLKPWRLDCPSVSLSTRPRARARRERHTPSPFAVQKL